MVWEATSGVRKVRSSRIVGSKCPLRNSMSAATRWSADPIEMGLIRARAMAGWVSSACSTSIGFTFRPPTSKTSFVRPVTRNVPFCPRAPRSPVAKKPSSVGGSNSPFDPMVPVSMHSLRTAISPSLSPRSSSRISTPRTVRPPLPRSSQMVPSSLAP